MGMEVWWARLLARIRSIAELTYECCACLSHQLAQINAFPGPRSVVVLDNASIHRSRAFVDAVFDRGAHVLFTPPYCWDLTPLDNGAFGKVKLYLLKNSLSIVNLGLNTRDALEAALLWAVPYKSASARQCVHNCGYEF